jgi:hypothetical protein
VRLEANYILACQHRAQGPFHGAINNVYGAPTWVVPSENAMAILGLVHASEVLHDPTYRDRAEQAADFLIRVQDPVDGAWYNQYDHNVPGAYDLAKSPRHTAQVMIALHELGYSPARYEAMKKGAGYLLECQAPENKGGLNDGLLGGGKDASGRHYGWRWTHDAGYGYWGLKAASDFASRAGDTKLAVRYDQGAARIIEGLNNYLYDPAARVWRIAIDPWGRPVQNAHLGCASPADGSFPSWIQYAPQMLDLPAYGVNEPAVGEWIYEHLTPLDGSCVGCLGYDCEGGQVRARKYPGFAFQAALSWYDTGHLDYAQSAIEWAEYSTLWKKEADDNDVQGGWVDWEELSPTSGRTAVWWLRLVDTSTYYLFCWSRGHDFRLGGFLAK